MLRGHLGLRGQPARVENMDIHYAQSAVFTPSDFQFPTNTIKAEATANTEIMLIVDVDVSQLKELHEHGSVQIMKDRRTDLYDVSMKRSSRRVAKKASHDNDPEHTAPLITVSE